MSITATSAQPFFSLNLEGVTKSVNLSNVREEGQLGDLKVVSANEKSVTMKAGDYEINVTTDGTVTFLNQETGKGGKVWGDPHYRTFEKSEDGKVTESKDLFDMKQDSSIQLAPGLSLELEMVKAPNGTFWVKEAAVHQDNGENNDTTVRLTGVEPDKIGKTAFKLEIWGKNGDAQNAQSDAGVQYAANANGTLRVLANGEFGKATKARVAEAEQAYAKTFVNSGAGAEELAKANGLSQKAADALKTVMGDRSVEDVLGKDVDYSKMSWSAALFHVLGKLLDKTGAEIKKKATELGQAESAKPEEGKEGDKAAEGKDGAKTEAKTEAKTDSTKIESAKVELNRLYEQMKSLSTFVQNTAATVADTNDKVSRRA